MRGLLSSLCACLLAACAGDGEGAPADAPPTAATLERLQAQVFDVSCSSDSCHSSVGRAGNLVLEAGASWDQLVDQPPSNPVAAAHGWKRVESGNPDNSFIVAKLTNNLAAGEGFPMPYNAAPLDTDTIDVLRAWIAAGAPADGQVPGDHGGPLNGGSDEPGEIALPPPQRGTQLAVTARALALGSEETLCHYMKLPSDVDLDVNRIQIRVSGGSHHIHVYRAYESGVDIPDGFEECNFAVDFDQWALVIATQLRETDWELPPGVAFHLRAGEQLLVQTHFVNVGSLETASEGKVLMNLHDADPGTVEAHAGALFGQDKDVFVPALSNPTKSAVCEFPEAINVFAETGHYHFRGRRFSTYEWYDGVRGAEVYRHEGYDDPLFLIHTPALAIEAGHGLEWECYWENTTDVDYEFGPFTDENEHCNFFAFYYPTATPNESITCVTSEGVAMTTIRRGD
jgi:hypothetical protein